MTVARFFTIRHQRVAVTTMIQEHLTVSVQPNEYSFGFAVVQIFVAGVDLVNGCIVEVELEHDPMIRRGAYGKRKLIGSAVGCREYPGFWIIRESKVLYDAIERDHQIGVVDGAP